MSKLDLFDEIMNNGQRIDPCDILGEIISHYRHAVEKHPWFCDEVCHEDRGWELDAKQLKSYLVYCTERHEKGEKTYCKAKDVLNAEMAEIFAAYSRGDFAQARYEIYDAIAVLLRMDDMIAEMQDKTGED